MIQTLYAWTAFFIGFAVFTGCEENASNDNSARPQSTSGIEKYASMDDLPPCDESQKDRMVFSTNENSFFICDGSSYVATSGGNSEESGFGEIYDSAETFPVCDASRKDSIVFSRQEGKAYLCNGSEYISSAETNKAFQESIGEEGGAGLELACEGALDIKPPAPTQAGQLAIEIPIDVDPCSVGGFIVGQVGKIELQKTKQGDFFFDNVPPGSNDVVVTAGTIALSLAGPASDRGLRLNKIVTNFGITTKLGKVSLPKLGSISGKVTLNTTSITDFAGIRVYVPGTSYAANSDVDGSYSLTGLPAGIHNLFFEKDGYGRGQIENIIVNPEANTDLDKLELSLDTGETGTFIFANGLVSEVTKNYIPGSLLKFNVQPSDNAVLMLLKREGSESVWQPINTNFDIEFDLHEYLKPLYLKRSAYESAVTYEDYFATSPILVKYVAKFANANGLESDLVEREVYLDYFAEGNEPFKPEFTVTKESNGPGVATKVTLDNFQHPPRAGKMDVNRYGGGVPTTFSTNSYDTSDYVELQNKFEFDYKDSVSSCGDLTFNVDYLSKDGKVKVSGNSYGNPLFNTSTLSSFTRKTSIDCVTPVASTTLLKSVSSTSASVFGLPYYSTWTGSKLFVMGWNDADEFSAALYLPDSNTWEAVTTSGAVPAKRTEGELFHVGEKVFFTAINPSSDVDLYVYNLSSQAWEDITASTNYPDFSNSSFDLGAKLAHTDSAIYFFYAKEELISSTYHYLLHVRSFNISTNTWGAAVDISNSNTYRSAKLMVPYGDKILMVDIEDQSSSTGKVAVFDPSDNSYTNKNDMPGSFSVSPSFQHVSKYYPTEDKFLIDWRSDGYSSASAIYSPTEDTWVASKSFSSLSSSETLATEKLNELIYVGYSIQIGNLDTGDLVTGDSFGLIPQNRSFLLRAIIPGKGILLWGGVDSSYVGSTQVHTVKTDGLILRTDYSELWD